jgi:hypothetical protein
VHTRKEITMTPYETLIDLLRGQVTELTTPTSRLAVCPTLGGRVFADIGGVCAHRLDLDNVAAPNRPFNNYGGGARVEGAILRGSELVSATTLVQYESPAILEQFLQETLLAR